MNLRQMRLSTSWGPLRLAGGSRAGEGSLLLLPQLNLGLDPGRPHRALPPLSTLVVSHGHTDHLGALAYWASQRFLHQMGAATVYTPSPIVRDLNELLTLHARLEGGRPYQVEVVGVDDGCSYPLRKDIVLSFFATDHWVPTVGTQVQWRRQRLLPELHGASPQEIARLRREGAPITHTHSVGLIAYGADCGPLLLERRPEIFDSEVVILECSFFTASDRARAARYGHMHLDDLIAHADAIRCRHLVLVHGSRRQRLREIEETIDKRLRPHIEATLHHLNIDWD
jgi:ribonuclease Z